MGSAPGQSRHSSLEADSPERSGSMKRAKPGMAVHACNPSIKDAETGACYKFQVSFGYRTKTFLKKILKVKQG